MSSFARFYQWLGLRAEEARVLWLCFSGSFLVMAYMVLARSLREALYLDAFNVKTLPFMTLAYVVLGLPTAAAFSYFLAKHYPQSVLKKAVLIGMAGLLGLWPIAHLETWAIILFYLWTTLLGIVLTSGLWLVIAEHFQVHRAKSLYGWISAGGTLGAMTIGISLIPLAKKVPILNLTPAVVILLALFYLVLSLLPRPEGVKSPRATEDEGKMSFTEGIGLVLNSPYLSAIAVIVFSATLASTLLDYQFKEYVQHALKGKAAMAGFFGGFYGWAGGLSLLVQILLTSRLLGKAGIGWTLSILPFILISGSSAFFLLPSFLIATGMRGLDQSFRKSFHRSAIEVLYVPVSTEIRKKTKTLIDSVLDSVAEGSGALIVFILITLGNMPSHYLSLLIILSAAVLLYRTLRIDGQYYETLMNRILEKGEELENSNAELPAGIDLLDASFSSMNMQEIILAKRGGKSVPGLVKSLLVEDTDFAIRRRIPKILAKIPAVGAEEGLLRALCSQPFEVRYLAAIGLMKRHLAGYPRLAEEPRKEMIWQAIRFEVNLEQPVWEMQTILDALDPWERDDFPHQQVQARGQLSLEHVFRMLALIFDSKLISAAYQGLAMEKTKLKGFSLEYLEHVLPGDVREKLWLFIGDVTEDEKQDGVRSLEEIAAELLKTEKDLLKETQ